MSRRFLKEKEEEQLRLWFAARDFFLGRNFCKQSIGRALEIASTCEHPHAVWLCSVFKDVSHCSPKEARAILLKSKKTGLSLSLAALLVPKDALVQQEKRRLLEEAANLGDSLALAELGRAGGDDPASLFSRYVRDGDMDALQRAAALGNVEAQFKFGLSLSASDYQRYFFWGKACAAGYNPHFFVLASCKQWRIFRNYRSNPNVICSIGFALAPFLDTQRQTVYGINVGKDEWDAVQEIVYLHLKWANSCRQAMDLFSLFAKAELRYWINADIRKLIVRLIWRERFAYMKEED